MIKVILTNKQYEIILHLTKDDLDKIPYFKAALSEKYQEKDEIMMLVDDPISMAYTIMKYNDSRSDAVKIIEEIKNKSYLCINDFSDLKNIKVTSDEYPELINLFNVIGADQNLIEAICRNIPDDYNKTMFDPELFKEMEKYSKNGYLYIIDRVSGNIYKNDKPYKILGDDHQIPYSAGQMRAYVNFVLSGTAYPDVKHIHSSFGILYSIDNIANEGALLTVYKDDETIGLFIPKIISSYYFTLSKDNQYLAIRKNDKINIYRLHAAKSSNKSHTIIYRLHAVKSSNKSYTIIYHPREKIWSYQSTGGSQFLEFANDTKLLVGSEHQITVYHSGKLIWEYQSEKIINDISFSPDSSMVALATNDRLVFYNFNDQGMFEIKGKDDPKDHPIYCSNIYRGLSRYYGIFIDEEKFHENFHDYHKEGPEIYIRSYNHVFFITNEKVIFSYDNAILCKVANINPKTKEITEFKSMYQPVSINLKSRKITEFKSMYQPVSIRMGYIKKYDGKFKKLIN